MICRNDIANLKTDIFEKVGQKIIVKGSLGRSKAFEKEATIEKAYPNLFIVKYDENNRNVTYSYTDVLTRTVEVDVYDGEKYNGYTHNTKDYATYDADTNKGNKYKLIDFPYFTYILNKYIVKI